MLNEYLESRRDVFHATRRKRTPSKMHPGRLHRILCCFHRRESRQDLLDFPAEYYDCIFELGFVELDGHSHWIEMIVGEDNLEATVWK